MTCTETTTWSAEYGQLTWGGIATTPPKPPSSYTAPTPTGSIVNTYAALAAEVALAGPRVIVVADGTYSGVGLTTNQGHQIWAENQGGATFDFGIGFRGNGGNAGGEVHGVIFNVTDIGDVDSTALMNEAIINTWDSVAPYTIGSNLVIEDCEFYGNDIIGSAIQAASPSGLVVRRCIMRDFIDTGVFAFRNGSGPDDFDTIILEDLDIANISRTVPGSGLGLTSESALVIGHRFEVRRVLVRNCSWSGIGLINEVNNWTIEDADIDQIGFGYFESGSVGIYCEESHDGLICRSTLGSEMKIGVNCEWNGDNVDPYLNNYIPRNYNITVQDSIIDAYKIGISFDISVSGCLVQRCQISRAWKAGVLDNNQFPDDDGDFPVPDGYSAISSTNVVDYESCTFCLHTDVPAVSYNHHDGPGQLPTITDWGLTPGTVDTSLLICYGASISDITDLAGNPIFAPSRTSVIGFAAASPVFSSNKIYDSHIEGIRSSDNTLFWKRFCEGPEQVRLSQQDRILELKSLANAGVIEEEHLELLTLTYGWDQVSKASILDKLEDGRLRLVLSQSPELWKRRGAGGSLIEAMNLLIGVRAFERTWFDDRWVLGESAINDDANFLLELGRRESQVFLVDPARVLDKEVIVSIAQKWKPAGERIILTWAEFIDYFDDTSQGWQAQSGSFSISDGVMSISSTQNSRIMLPDARSSLADTVTAATFTWSGNSEFGLLSRSNVALSGIEARVSGLGTARLLHNGLEVGSVALDSFGILLNPDYNVHLRLEIQDQNVGFYVNNHLTLQFSDNSIQTTGLSGIFAATGVSVEAQSYEVLPLPGENVYVDINARTREF